MGIIPTINQTDILREGLFGRWMGGVHGVPALGTVRDLTSKGNDGTCVGNAFINGDGLQLDGTGDYIDISDNSAIYGATKLSAFAWIRQSSPLAIGRAIMTKWDFQTQGTFALQTNVVLQNGELILSIATSPTNNGAGCRVDTTDAGMLADKWYHVGFVFDGTQTGNTSRLKFYVDGRLTIVTQTYGAVPASLTSATATLKLGTFGGSLTRYFTGSISDARIYNRALVQSEISQVSSTTKWRHQ